MCLLSGKDYVYLKDASLKKYCTFKVGGNAKHLIEVYNLHALQTVYYKCKLHNIRCKVIGMGANLLFDDAGFDGVIIVNKTHHVLFKNNSVYSASGVNLSGLIVKCLNRCLGGFERLAGIPATVGGATVNSLGAFETNFCDFIEHVKCIEIDTGKIKILTNEKCKFAYRDSIFKTGKFIILSVKLNLKFMQQEVIKENMQQAINKKLCSQPLNYPSAGSIFKRTDVIPAKLIDQLGLKGLKVGGAMVSTKHAGFIINYNNATAVDIINLIEIIREKVKSAYNVNLALEMEIVK